jgi:hypothetical protein
MTEDKKVAWWNAKRSAVSAAAKAKAEADGSVAKEQTAPAPDTGTPPVTDPVTPPAPESAPVATLPDLSATIAKATEPLQAQIEDLTTKLSAALTEIAALKTEQQQATAKAATDLTQAVEKAGKAAQDAEAAAKRIDGAFVRAQEVADGIAALAPRGGMRLPRIDERGKTAVGKEISEDPVAAKMREEREARRQATAA